jgi:serine/threonine-protein kinase
MVGSTVKGFRIVAKIRDGSVGTVYKVAHLNNRVFALKILSEKNAADGRKRRLFKKEAQTGMRLDHRGIVKVYQYDESGPRPFFLMEYFPSESLKYAMWHLPDRVYTHEFYILRQAAEALAYVHAQGIVHRDVKPENLLISPDGTVKLIDFSLAQTKWDRLNPFARRREGTPLYMAPEQILGRAVDHRADIYSFGAVMYELITKRPPYLGTTEKSILEKHLKAPPPSIRSIVPTVDQELEAMVLKAMAKNPDDRFPDMTAILYELSKWEKKTTIIRVRQVDPGKAREQA